MKKRERNTKHSRIGAFLCGLATICLGLGLPASLAAEKLTQYVDPRIGTAHCRWFHFTPGALSFGMAKPGPSTNGHLGNKDGWEATGYDYRDSSIEGFPCFHEFQVGGVVLVPLTGQLTTIPGPVDNQEGIGYRSFFDRKDEVATAGYYSVWLQDYDVQAELTATNRVAFQQYTFPESKESHILFDIGNWQGESGAIKDASVWLTDGNCVEGWVETLPEYVNKYQPGGSVTLYFSAVTDKQPASYGAFNGADIKPQQTGMTGKGAGIYLTFETAPANRSPSRQVFLTHLSKMPVPTG